MSTESSGMHTAGIDISAYSRRHARAQRHVQRQTQPSRGIRGAAGIAGATVTTGVLAAAMMAPAAVADSTEEDFGDGKVASRFGADKSWADFTPGGISEASGLEKQPAAASRAKFRLPVEVSPCVPVEAADGARQMLQQSRFYMPLQEGAYAISSGYGYRIHPVTGAVAFHSGVDMMAPMGTPIHAVADGVVTQVTSGANEGGYNVIEHVVNGQTFYSHYLHQYTNQIPTVVGQQVSAGEVIGYVGNAGRSTGPHLHLEIRDAADNTLSPTGWLTQNGAVFIGEGC